MKSLTKFVVAVSIVTAGAAAQAQNSIPPSQGLPTCSGIYAAMSVFAAPENRQILKDRSTQIAMESRKYNANGPDDAINQAKYIIGRVNANDQQAVAQTINAEKNCRVYLKQYGL